jgi:hypothetical protein
MSDYWTIVRPPASATGTESRVEWNKEEGKEGLIEAILGADPPQDPDKARATLARLTLADLREIYRGTLGPVDHARRARAAGRRLRGLSTVSRLPGVRCPHVLISVD